MRRGVGTPGTIVTAIQIMHIVAVASVVAYVVTSVAFLFWCHQTTGNSRLLTEHPLDVTAGWAVGWWFVPIANLFKPLAMIRQNYNLAVRRMDRTVPVRSGSTPELVGWWWAAWVICSIGSRVVSRLHQHEVMDSNIVAGLRYANSLCTIVVAILAIQVVQRISNGQHRGLG